MLAFTVGLNLEIFETFEISPFFRDLWPLGVRCDLIFEMLNNWFSKIKSVQLTIFELPKKSASKIKYVQINFRIAENWAFKN